MSKPIGKSSSVNPSGTNDAKTHGTSSKMGNLLAGMLEADPDFKKVVSRYMNRAGFDTTSSTAHPVHAHGAGFGEGQHALLLAVMYYVLCNAKSGHLPVGHPSTDGQSGH